MSKKIILFNGPPRSGKDTAVNLLAHQLGNVYKHKMAFPLKYACHSMLGLQGSLESLEHLKEEPISVCKADGTQLTLRQFYITMSEDFMKPTFGEDVFGKFAVEYISASGKDLVTISDSGFEEEAMPIVNEYGAENVCLVRIHREGKTFAGDSRRYIDLPVKTVIDIHNNGTFEEFSSKLFEEITTKFLNV